MKRPAAEEPRDDVLRRQVNEIIRLGVKGRHIAEVVGVNEGTIRPEAAKGSSELFLRRHPHRRTALLTRYGIAVYTACAVTPKQIRKLRRALKEDTRTFGARFSRSSRTIEDWEQGRRQPDKLVRSMLAALKRPNNRWLS
jgi:DNA-binding transcriptional regulator YiaG